MVGLLLSCFGVRRIRILHLIPLSFESCIVLFSSLIYIYTFYIYLALFTPHLHLQIQPEIFRHSSYISELHEDKIPQICKSGTRENQRRIFFPSQFSYEWIRRKTFDAWPVEFVSKDELAKAGFFYLRTRDLVQCFFCKGIIGYWECGDRPFTEHEKHFPSCPFVQGMLTSNVPYVAPEEGDKTCLNGLLNDILQQALERCLPPLPANRLHGSGKSKFALKILLIT